MRRNLHDEFLSETDPFNEGYLAFSTGAACSYDGLDAEMWQDGWSTAKSDKENPPDYVGNYPSDIESGSSNAA